MIENETMKERVARKLPGKEKAIAVAAGREKADLVLKNASFVNVFSNEMQTADIAISGGLIVGIGEYDGKTEYDVSGKIVSPGFIDAHIHLESAIVSPTEFAKATVPHGTTTVICDPHEIANVMGTDGIDYMLEATEGLPVDVHFMLPSCVPATPEDESGAVLTYEDLDPYFDNFRVLGLAEMMNFVGVVAGDTATVSKILTSQGHHKKIDGHAPDLTGKDLNAYIAAGVYSDHECHNIENALEKLRLGQFIMIREGTAAKNLTALMPLLNGKYASRCMFCTDDKHPNDLLCDGHIDSIVRKAVRMGADPIVALKVATHNAARYFLMNNKGAIAPGYLADIIVMDNLTDFNVETVFKKGKLVYDKDGVKPFVSPKIDKELLEKAENSFCLPKVEAEDFKNEKPLGLIGLVKGEIYSENLGKAEKIDVENDILKIAVVERHKNTGHIGVGFIKGYGLKKGAVATSVAHDSHNIIVVGADEESMAKAVSVLVEQKGGIVVYNGEKTVATLPFEIAGLMTDRPLVDVNEDLENAKKEAKNLGVSADIDPFMTLSFMSLPVIPSLRITTKGVFDVSEWKYI